MHFSGEEGMPVFRFVNGAVRKSLAPVLIALLAVVGFAQETPPPASPTAVELSDAVKALPQAPAPQRNAYKLYSDQNYSRGQSQWPRFWSVWGVRNMPQANFTNTPLIDQVIRDGKMYLSLDEAVALSLENNLDIAIQRYNLITADVDILRTSSGSPALGVNTGLVQGTPGGPFSTATSSTVGGGAGGTSIGIGGAGAGAAGIVTSTQGFGAPIDNFDPVLTGTIQGQRSTTPEANTVFTGTPRLNQNTETYNFAYTQGFSTGTLMTVGFQNARNTANAIFNSLNPYLTTSFNFQLRQHLLQGWGFNSNMRWIRIARNNRAIMDSAYQNQIMTSVSQIENIYWDLVNAYENVKVQQRALDLAQKTLSDTEKQVEIGTLAPITVVQSKSSVASAQQNLIVSQTTLQLQQLLMKNAITKNNTDAILATAPVIPTDTLQINEPFEVPPVEQLVESALKHRPEIIQSRINLTNREVGLKAIKNLQLPTLDAYAFYGAAGLAGDQNIYNTCGNPGVPPNNCVPPGTVPSTGYGHSFGYLFNSSAPDKG